MRFFIPYRQHDHKLALKLGRDLRDSGHQVWLEAIEQPHPKRKQALRSADHVVMLRQPARFNDSRLIVAQSAEEVFAASAPPQRSRRRALMLLLLIMAFGTLALTLSQRTADDSPQMIAAQPSATATTLAPTSTTFASQTATTTPTITPSPSPTFDYTATVDALEAALYGEQDTDIVSDTQLVNDSDSEIPFAEIYAEPLSGQAPLTVTFYNDTFGDAAEYQWDFDGDGITDSTEFEPPPRVFLTAGEYVVSMTALNADGLGETAQIRVIVYGENVDESLTPTTTPTPRATPNPGEVFASFAAEPASGTAPISIAFNNDTLGDAASYAWDFNGDGITDSTSVNPRPYAYTTPGEYTVTLTVVSTAGLSDSISTIVIIYAPTEQDTRPQASFTVDAESGPAPLTVTFTNTTSGQARVYLWDFDGDGVTDSRDQNPQPYTYNTAGTYRARLIVSGNGGVSAPYYQEIVVGGEAPTATASSTATLTATASPTTTASPTIIPSSTPFPMLTSTSTPTATATQVILPSATLTTTLTPSMTMTHTATVTSTQTVVPSETPTPTVTASASATLTPSVTATWTTTPTLTWTPTATLTATATSTATPTVTASPTDEPISAP